MIQVLTYTALFLLIFLMTAIAAVAVWAVFERSSSKASPRPAAGEPSGILRSEVLTTISLFVPLFRRVRLIEKLKALLAEADLNWSVGRTVLGMLLLGGVTLDLLLRLGWLPWVAAVAGAALIAGTPVAYIRHRKTARLRQVEDQLPEALDYLSRAMVAGHSLPMSLELLAEEADPPLSIELRKTVDEYNLGLSMTDALVNLAVRLPSLDVQFFVSAVRTQSRTGGSLNELLEKLAETIRDRALMHGQVRALTANGHMTAVILSLLPFLVGGVMITVNPDYFQMLLDHPWGTTLLALALCGQVLAYFVIRKIVDIKP